MRRLAPACRRCAAATGASRSLLGSHDTDKPIDITADKDSADLNAKTVTYSGNVIVTQGDIHMHADAMKVNTADGKHQTIIANGNVVVDSPASGTATGDNGVYDVHQPAGDAYRPSGADHDKDIMRGTMLTVNLVTGQAMSAQPVAGSANQARAGRRAAGYRASFTPQAAGGN